MPIPEKIAAPCSYAAKEFEYTSEYGFLIKLLLSRYPELTIKNSRCELCLAKALRLALNNRAIPVQWPYLSMQSYAYGFFM